MISPESIRQKLSEETETLKRFKVSELWLFGSAARHEMNVHDLDFLVEFAEPPGLLDYMELKFFLEGTFALPVDLHSRGSCPPRFFDRIRDDLQHVA